MSTAEFNQSPNKESDIIGSSGQRGKEINEQIFVGLGGPMMGNMSNNNANEYLAKRRQTEKLPVQLSKNT